LYKKNYDMVSPVVLIKLIFYTLLLFYSFSSGQTIFTRLNLPIENKLLSDSISYLYNPIQPGNHWQYTDYEGKIYNKRFIKDTIIENKNYSKIEFFPFPLTYERNGKMASYVFDHDDFDFNTATKELLADSLELPIGSSYLSYRYAGIYGSEYEPHEIVIEDKFLASIGLFDDTVYVVEIDIWTLDGWLEATEFWAEKYGLIDIIPEGNRLFLTGAIVNGESYGTVVRINETSHKSTHDKSGIDIKHSYPNPFNSKVNILFTLSQSAKGIVIIFNVAGKKINEFTFNKENGKNIKIEWYGDNLDGEFVSSGVYYYSIFINGKAYTQKVVLLK